MKFSEWMRNARIPHKLTQIKGGYMISLIDPDTRLKELISSLFVSIDTGEVGLDHMAIRKDVNVYTSSGDTIFIDEKHYADILNTIQPAIRDYVLTRKF